MPDVTHTLTVLLLGLGILGPLLLALGTLRGMRAKRIYPLLRVKDRQGVSTVWDAGPNGASMRSKVVTT